MKPLSQIRNKSLFIATALGFTSQAALAVTGMIPQADFASLDGLTSGSIIVSGVTDNGVVVDLNFLFGTNIGLLADAGRLGIDSTSNVGSASATAINSGEILSLSVTPTIVSVPTGQSVVGIDFGISEADFVRSGPGNGDARYLWNSSAASSTSPYTATTGSQPFETLDDTSLFDIFSTAYNATFTTEEQAGDPNASGFRFDTGSDNIDFTLLVRTEAIATVPEPSRAVLLALGLVLATSARRRR